MKTYCHRWKDHDTVYFQSIKGLCKLNIHHEGNRTVGEVYDLIVFPGYRGQGFGRRLLSAAFHKAKSLGCDYLLLWPDSDPWVKEWYVRFGFRKNPEFRNYSNEPSYALQLNKAKNLWYESRWTTIYDMWQQELFASCRLSKLSELRQIRAPESCQIQEGRLWFFHA